MSCAPLSLKHNDSAAIANPRADALLIEDTAVRSKITYIQLLLSGLSHHTYIYTFHGYKWTLTAFISADESASRWRSAWLKICAHILHITYVPKRIWIVILQQHYPPAIRCKVHCKLADKMRLLNQASINNSMNVIARCRRRYNLRAEVVVFMDLA